MCFLNYPTDQIGLNDIQVRATCNNVIYDMPICR